MVRPQTLPILPFLAPSVPRSWLQVSSTWRQTQCRNFNCRGSVSLFTITGRERADSPTPTKHAEDRGPGPNARRHDTPQRDPPHIVKDPKPEPPHDPYQINAMLERLVGDGTRSVVDDVEEAFEDKKQADSYRNTPGSVANNMKLPSSWNESTQAQQDRQRNLIQRQINARPPTNPRFQRHTVQPRPTVGRTIELDPNRGIDFGRSLGILASRLKQERVKQDKAKQRFHERKGAKRKRLKSERWRRYFKAGFDATVARVKQMKMQGW